MANTKNMSNKSKHLEAEGEMSYDYANDILFFKVKNREYNSSIEFQNMVIDVDKEEFIVGLQIFDASKFLQIDKSHLGQMPKWKFQARIDGNTIELRLFYQVSIRNQIIEKNPIIIQENTTNLPEQTMTIPA